MIEKDSFFKYSKYCIFSSDLPFRLIDKLVPGSA